MKKIPALVFLLALLAGSTVAAFATGPATPPIAHPTGPDHRGPIDPVPPTSAPPPPSI